MTGVGPQPGHVDATRMVAFEVSFTEEEYAARLERLLGMASEQRRDLLWNTSPEGVAWTHGFFASWHTGQGPMRYPQRYGTAVHVESVRFIHFDNSTEEPVLARTSICRDNRYTPDREVDPTSVS
ncbi:MAG: hypothetical protein GDA49_04380 [Rhodospirillales bacterium]|nr:hypothetical protein [Rhodospirillales bacterium]